MEEGIGAGLQNKSKDRRPAKGHLEYCLIMLKGYLRSDGACGSDSQVECGFLSSNTA